MTLQLSDQEWDALAVSFGSGNAADPGVSRAEVEIVHRGGFSPHLVVDRTEAFRIFRHPETGRITIDDAEEGWWDRR